MILINVLPQHLRPIKRTPIPYILSVVVFIIACLVMGALYLAGLAAISNANAQLADTEERLLALNEVVEEFNRLTQQKIELQKRVETIQEILSDRIIWSEVLHQLTELMPENIWFSNVAVENQRFREQVEKRDPKTGEVMIDKRTGQPSMETRTRIQPILVVSGYAIRDADGNVNIGAFTDATATDPAFRAQFRLLPSTFSDTNFGGYNVRDFTVRYEIVKGAKSE